MDAAWTVPSLGTEPFCRQLPEPWVEEEMGQRHGLVGSRGCAEQQPGTLCGVREQSPPAPEPASPWQAVTDTRAGSRVARWAKRQTSSSLMVLLVHELLLW